MPKVGSKGKLVLDLAGRDQLLHELKSLLDSRLGRKRAYRVAVAFSSDDDETVYSYELEGLNDKTPFKIYRMVVAFFAGDAKRLLSRYDISGVELPTDGIETYFRGEKR